MTSDNENKNEIDTITFNLSLISFYIFCHFSDLAKLPAFYLFMIVFASTSYVFWRKFFGVTNLYVHDLIGFSALWGFVSFLFLFAISQICSFDSMSWLFEADYYKYSIKHFAHMLYPNLFCLTGIIWVSGNLAKLARYVFAKYEFNFLKDGNAYKIVADDFGHTFLYVNDVLKSEIKNKFTLKQKSTSRSNNLECMELSRIDFTYRLKTSITLAIAYSDKRTFDFPTFDKYHFKSTLIAAASMLLISCLSYCINFSSISKEFTVTILSAIFEMGLWVGYITSKMYHNRRSTNEVHVPSML